MGGEEGTQVAKYMNKDLLSIHLSVTAEFEFGKQPPAGSAAVAPERAGIALGSIGTFLSFARCPSMEVSRKHWP